ncbi:RTA1-like protein [Artomyces pyxidatus]|uniref:RTA1-like protein n=1 Tax=Artomyces pyxidatus TaxID=48021 RepID=A0ACB8TK11_9AGAM|nr:RTA1-like protein [Artomyces pyxidatus]
MAPSPRNLAVIALAAALFVASPALASLKGPSVPPPADPYADPANDPDNPMGYIASNGLTTVALILIVSAFIGHAFNLIKWGAWWLTCLAVGEITFALGIAARYALHAHPDSKNIYITEYLLVVLSPCAFIAADYILLGRLAMFLDGGDHLFIRPSRIGMAFLLSDVSTFLIQALGGTVSLQSNTSKGAALGAHISLTGLGLQLFSFVVFTAIFIRFSLRIRKYEPRLWLQDEGKGWFNDWRTIIIAMCISCVGITIRSVYRILENAQGFKGSISRNETTFYLFDTLPLWLAVVVYVPFWPGRLLPAKGSRAAFDHVEMREPKDY